MQHCLQSPGQKQPQCPSTDGRIKKWYICNGILLSHKTKWTNIRKQRLMADEWAPVKQVKREGEEECMFIQPLLCLSDVVHVSQCLVQMSWRLGDRRNMCLWRRILWSSPRLSDPSTHVLSTKNPGPPPTVARKGQRCWVAATQWWLLVPRRGHWLLWAQSQYPRSSGRTGCRQGYKVGWYWPSQLWVTGCPLGLDVACGGLLPA